MDVRVTTSMASNGKETVSRAITHVSEYRPYKPAEQLSLDDLSGDNAAQVDHVLLPIKGAVLVNRKKQLSKFLWQLPLQ